MFLNLRSLKCASVFVLVAGLVAFSPATGWGQFTIPFGNGGRIQMGPGGIRITTPNRVEGDFVRPGVTIPIPFRRPDPEYVPSHPIYPPQYVPEPQYVPQAQYVPQQTVVVAPPQNVVKPVNKPKLNNLDKSHFAARSSAETDARQAIEAEKAKGMLDIDITQKLKSLNKPDLIKDWNDVIRGEGKSADVAAFMNKYAADIPPNVRERLELRQKFSIYSEGVQGGLLSAAQKESALADLKASVAAAGAKPGANAVFFNNLAGNVTNMQNLNTMGQIADAAQGISNPFIPLLVGSTQIGMPPMFVSEMTGVPVLALPPAATDASSGVITMLVNPQENGQEVQYNLNGNHYVMKPGETQKLSGVYSLDFNPGSGDAASKRYTLSSGVFEWRLDPAKGWDIFQVQVHVVIDNSRYEGSFQYLANNEYRTVAAGAVAEHKGNRPVEVVFNSGSGSNEIRKTLKSGRYIVGIDPEKGGLDLFESESVSAWEAKYPEYVSTTKFVGNNASREQRVAALLAQLQRSGEPSFAGESGQALRSGGISPLGGAVHRDVNELLRGLQPPAKP